MVSNGWENPYEKAKDLIGILISENVNITDDNVFESSDDDQNAFW
jgi:hypothetical protein